MRNVLLLAIVPAVLSAQSPDSTRRDSSSTTRKLETVTVSAIRAGTDAPVAATTLDAAELKRRSFGQDVPSILQGTPSLTSYSETGNYWGYSYIRMRGIDQSRINLTLDGIPLNDPEDQVLYFADFPDLTASLGSVQVQRGVGTSAPGSASYGGSINFQTKPLTSNMSGPTADVQLQAGSFGTLRGSAEYSSGLAQSGFAAYARASAIRSTGYRRHSGVDARSGFASIGWVGKRDIVKLTATAGLFADTMAYVGATRAELATDDRANLLRTDETDRFTEQVVALSHTRQLSAAASLQTTLYRIAASGHYNCTSQCGLAVGDVWDNHLDFTSYGSTIAWTLNRDRFSASAGANANAYARDHYSFDRPASGTAARSYFNTGHKGDGGLFAKASYDVGNATLFVDVQGRRAVFRYLPDASAGIAARSTAWSFFNPKMGATLRLTPLLSAYASYSVSAREPARVDMLAGLDNLDAASADTIGPLSRVRPERVRDTEGGVRLAAGAVSFTANAFLMSFRNEILPVGILVQGYSPLRTNVPSSWRRGVELDGSAALDRLHIGATATLMRARISRFTDEATATSYRDVPPLLTPEFTTTQWATMQLSREFAVGATGRFVGNSYLNNTKTDTLALPSQYTLDLSAHWANRGRGVSLYVNNATNSRRFAGGQVYGGEARYFVLPPRNAMLIVRL